MDPDESLCAKGWIKSSSSSSCCSSGNDVLKNLSSSNQPFFNFGMQQQQQQQQKFEDTSYLCYQSRIEKEFSEFTHQSDNLLAVNNGGCNSSQNKVQGQSREDDTPMQEANNSNKILDWDPRGMLNNLSFLEAKIHQLRDLVQVIVGRRNQVGNESNEVLILQQQQQQQLVTADLTSIIVQLISTAGSLLPSVKNTLASSISPSVLPHLGQFGGSTTTISPGVNLSNCGGLQQRSSSSSSNVNKLEDQSHEIDLIRNGVDEHEHEQELLKDEDDGEEGENLPPGSYEILQLEKEEILAPHTHFCTICGKGFKRDANLRMHMRGHGDEYKTPAALAKPHKESSSSSEPVLIKRYSCPYIGCKRNKDHKKFQPLKTILCVKNHYKRTHCDKSYTCSRCHTKKFSVIADLKTHEKHCGRDKWLCSCGTTFSRKDKLFGHIALFQGHTPAIPSPDDYSKVSAGSSSASDNATATAAIATATLNTNINKVEQMDFNTPSDHGMNAFRNIMDDPTSYFSPLYQEFTRPPPFDDDSETSFSFLLSGSGSGSAELHHQAHNKSAAAAAAAAVRYSTTSSSLE